MATTMGAKFSGLDDRRRESVWIQLVRRGDPFVWLTGGALAVAAVMILGILALIVANGLGSMWPGDLARMDLADGSVILGQIVRTEEIPAYAAQGGGTRHLVRIGNRDLYGFDFKWIDDESIVARSHPDDAYVVERREWGQFYGDVKELRLDGAIVSGPEVHARFQVEIDRGAERHESMRKIENGRIGSLNRAIESARLAIRRVELRGQSQTPEGARRIEAEKTRMDACQAEFGEVRDALEQLRSRDEAFRVVIVSARGEERDYPLSHIIRSFRPNQLSSLGKAKVYASRLWEFLTADPRESNTEGGIYPAIFGTVLMTLIMTIAVVPFGVVAALYLKEYAKQGPIVSAVRIAVNNLAGVPSIVFGLFGLGFFAYTLGGAIDHTFFPERLPAPTFGGGALIWASLTLALLTVPVVIVATEEALAAVPVGMREGSIACGATKFQTIMRIVLPSAAPGIMTGSILAMARGAGEVAPLMITGVVKLAPELPLDGRFPFLHLERKFMHLGFHIYDVGFQSPNVEAAKPMVYMTTFLLILIVVILNLAAILIRNRLRDKYKTGAFG